MFKCDGDHHSMTTCGKPAAERDQPLGPRDVHRGHAAQPRGHRRERHRQRHRHRHPHPVQPGRGQPEHRHLGRGHLDLRRGHRHLDRVGRDRERQHPPGRAHASPRPPTSTPASRSRPACPTAAPSVSGSKAVTGTPVNDPPSATNLSAPETYVEDTPLNLVDIVASDIDSATVTATLTLSSPAAGSLTTAPRARSPRPTSRAPASGPRRARSRTSTPSWPGSASPRPQLQRQLHDRDQRVRRRPVGQRLQGRHRHPGQRPARRYREWRLLAGRRRRGPRLHVFGNRCRLGVARSSPRPAPVTLPTSATSSLTASAAGSSTDLAQLGQRHRRRQHSAGQHRRRPHIHRQQRGAHGDLATTARSTTAAR